jgi:hypothetical protein
VCQDEEKYLHGHEECLKYLKMGIIGIKVVKIKIK